MLALFVSMACSPPVPALDRFEGASFSVAYPAGSEVRVVHRDTVVFDGVAPTPRFSEGWWVRVTTDRAAAFAHIEEGMTTGGGSGGAVYMLDKRYPTFGLAIHKHVPEPAWPPYRGQMRRELEAVARAIGRSYEPHPRVPDDPRHVALLERLHAADRVPRTLRLRIAPSDESAGSRECTVAIDGERQAVRCELEGKVPAYEAPDGGLLGRDYTPAGRMVVNQRVEWAGIIDGEVRRTASRTDRLEIGPHGEVTTTPTTRWRTVGLAPSGTLHPVLPEGLRALGRGYADALNHIEAVSEVDGVLQVRAIGHTGVVWEMTITEPHLVVVDARCDGVRRWSAEDPDGASVARRGVVYGDIGPRRVVTLLDSTPGVHETWMEAVQELAQPSRPVHPPRPGP